MFGRKSDPDADCRVYEYGCLPPADKETEEFFVAQIRKRNNLWNRLVEIERGYREQFTELIAVDETKIDDLVRQIEDLRESLSKEKQQTRSAASLETARARKTITVLTKELKEERKAVKQQRKELIEQKKIEVDALEKFRREQVKQACRESGLYWCNYEEVTASYEIARRKAWGKSELRFRRFDGSGKCTIRVIYREKNPESWLPVEKVFADDTRLQIDSVDERAWTSPVRAERRKLSRTKIRLRMASEGRKPVWVELPMVMHRPLPSEGQIRTASIVREVVAEKPRYKAVIAVKTSKAKSADGHLPAVAVDLGWRLLGEKTLRVAYWYDSNGQYGELILERKIVSQFLKLYDLRSIRDKHFNEVKEGVLKYRKRLPVLAERTPDFALWRSPRRLVGVVRRWERTPGDDEVYAILMKWYEREQHLYSWEANLRDQVIRYRREIYRIFAKELCSKYNTVALENFDLRQVAQKPTPESGTKGSLPPDRQRTIAAISVLRGAIENYCGREGIGVVRVEAKDSTRKCHVCGHVENKQIVSLIHECNHCHVKWDQDYNAAVVLLQRAGFANAPEFDTEKAFAKK